MEITPKKVDKLDAHIIDQEANMVLQLALNQAFTPQFLSKYQLEVKLFLDFLYFRCTVLKNRQTIGLKLQNL